MINAIARAAFLHWADRANCVYRENQGLGYRRFLYLIHAPSLFQDANTNQAELFGIIITIVVIETFAPITAILARIKFLILLSGGHHARVPMD